MNIQELKNTYFNKKCGISFEEFKILWEHYTPYKLKDDDKLKELKFKFAEVLNINKEFTDQEINELKYTNAYLCQAMLIAKD